MKFHQPENFSRSFFWKVPNFIIWRSLSPSRGLKNIIKPIYSESADFKDHFDIWMTMITRVKKSKFIGFFSKYRLFEVIVQLWGKISPWTRDFRKKLWSWKMISGACWIRIREENSPPPTKVKTGGDPLTRCREGDIMRCREMVRDADHFCFRALV